LTLRLDIVISDDTWSLLRGAPALTAAGLPPASLMQHRHRAVQTRLRSGRTMRVRFYPRPTRVAAVDQGEMAFDWTRS